MTLVNGLDIGVRQRRASCSKEYLYTASSLLPWEWSGQEHCCGCCFTCGANDESGAATLMADE